MNIERVSAQERMGARPPGMTRVGETHRGTCVPRSCALADGAARCTIGSMADSATDCTTFDYTAAIAAVCGDICFRVPELRHIDMSRVAVGFSRTKNSEPYGIFASATPLRFENGEPFYQSRGKIWTLQRHFRPDGVEYLYILYFYVPRFIELPLSQKLDTIVHELYHVSPRFNGDLRRFAGRRFAHGSKKQYDQTVKRLVQDWLKQDPPNDLWDFLCYNYRDLVAKYGKLSGTRIPAPRIVPLTTNS